MRVVLWHHCETALERSRATISPTKGKAVWVHGAPKYPFPSRRLCLPRPTGVSEHSPRPLQSRSAGVGVGWARAPPRMRELARYPLPSSLRVSHTHAHTHAQKEEGREKELPLARFPAHRVARSAKKMKVEKKRGRMKTRALDGKKSARTSSRCSMSTRNTCLAIGRPRGPGWTANGAIFGLKTRMLSTDSRRFDFFSA